MNYAIGQLLCRLTEVADPDLDHEFHARLAVLEIGDRLYLDYFGFPFDESYDELCKTFILPDVASRLESLTLRSPADDGSNGTRNWDLSPLVEPQIIFPNLRSFAIEQNAPGAHNSIIVGADFEEAGVLGRLLHMAPSLETLIVPSAPDETFFALQRRPLRFLSVDAGYDSQNFICNLARSPCFFQLESFEFGEYNQTHLDDFPHGCTPFEDYRKLFMSEVFSTIRIFVWRNPVCSEEEIAELRSLRPKDELQIQIVQFSSRFV